MLALLWQLEAACMAAADLAEAVEEAFPLYPDADVILSFPGLGAQLGARVLPEIGDVVGAMRAPGLDRAVRDRRFRMRSLVAGRGLDTFVDSAGRGESTRWRPCRCAAVRSMVRPLLGGDVSTAAASLPPASPRNRSRPVTPIGSQVTTNQNVESRAFSSVRKGAVVSRSRSCNWARSI